MSRAAAVRTQVDSQLSRFRTSSLSIHGVRQKTSGYYAARLMPATTDHVDRAPEMRLKTQVIKHKKSGAMVEKVSYYNAAGHLLLAERYLNGQLLRLTLHENYRRPGTELEKSAPGRTGEFVQGDYIRKSFRKGQAAEYFSSARPRS